MFDQIKANLVEIQPEKRQNVQKTGFLQKAPGFNGLINYFKMYKFLKKIHNIFQKKFRYFQDFIMNLQQYFICTSKQ